MFSSFLENQYRPILSIMSYHITIIIRQLSFASTSLQSFIPNKQFYQSCHYYNHNNNNNNKTNFKLCFDHSYLSSQQNKFLHHPSFHHYVQFLFFFFRILRNGTIPYAIKQTRKTTTHHQFRKGP